MASFPGGSSIPPISCSFRLLFLCFSPFSAVRGPVPHDFSPPDEELALQQPRCATRGQGKTPELRSFARGLGRDEAAVRAGLDLPWSQGQTEGQITRLKLIKRQGYGRASFDLLRQRVLHAA